MGTSLVLFSVYLMNESNKTTPTPTEKKPLSFQVKKKPPPKKIKKRTKRKRIARQSSNKVAPPILSNSIAGPSFDLPEFTTDDMNVSKSLLNNKSNQVFTANTVDTPPKAIVRVPPDIPKVASAEVITGAVKVRFQISSKGKVEKIKIVHSSPPGVFDENVVEALSSWVYEPAEYENSPVRISVIKVFKFN